MLAITMPSPRTPKVDHTCGALMRSMFHSTELTWPCGVPGSGSGKSKVLEAEISLTPGCVDSSWSKAASPVTRTTLTIQKEVKVAPRFCSSERRSAWLASATARSWSTTNWPRWSQSWISYAGLRSACWLK